MAPTPHTRDAIHKQRRGIARVPSDRMEGAGVHPQREYLASHLEAVADKVRNSPVKDSGLTPTEQATVKSDLAHAAEQASAPPTG